MRSVPFKLKHVQRIFGGGGHAFVLNSNGRLYACGWNHKGQLGIGHTKDVCEFVEVPVFCSEIIEIFCGWDSTAAIDGDGNLYVWGSNAFEQLGPTKRSKPYSTVPMSIELPHNRKASKVSFGLQFLSILCTDDVIYFVGRIKFTNECSSFVHKHVEFHELKRSNMPSVDHIASGNYHTVYASSDAKMVSGVGDNRYNQIESIALDEEIRKLCSGWTHTGVLTTEGNVYLYGRNTYGELGHSDATATGLVQLNCGDEFVEDLHLGSEHGLIQTESGTVRTWGWNEHGNCGHGDEVNVYVLSLVPSSVLAAILMSF